MSDYSQIASHYDFLFPKKEVFRQKPFFQKLIRNNMIKTCLDCACGTGWHLKMLKDMGLKVFGSDISKEMLIQAKNNLKGEKIVLKKTDYRKLDNVWKKKFDLVICMTTSFPHMMNEAQAIKALKSMYKILDNNGVLVIDNGFSDYLLSFQPKLIPARIAKNRAFYFFMEYYKKRLTYNILEVIKEKDIFRHLFESITYNAMRKNDFERYFSKTGFKQIKYFGDFHFSPYSKKASKRLIAVARKK